MNPLKHFIKIRKIRRDDDSEDAMMPTILTPSPPYTTAPIPPGPK